MGYVRLDPSDDDMHRRREELRDFNRRLMHYIGRCATRIAGGRFFAIGIFGAIMTVAFLDHPTLPYCDGGALWHPAIAGLLSVVCLGAWFAGLPAIPVLLFVVCYGAFFWAHSWYVRNPPGPDLSEEPARLDVWAPVGAGLALVVLAGSSLGLAACAAAIVVGLWLIAYRLFIGPTWSVYVQAAILLLITGIVPPALGWPLPNLFATIILGGTSMTMIAGGYFDHRQHRWITQRLADRLARQTPGAEEG